jgi:hypothetical protein
MWVVIGVVVAVAAAAAGLSLALTGGGGSGRSSDTVTGLSWKQRFAKSHVGDTKAAVLALWPKIPYQHYSDNLKEDCYEWQGDNLYNLCFADGVLRLKTVF